MTLEWTTQMIFKMCWKVENQPFNDSECGVNIIKVVLWESLTVQHCAQFTEVK